MGKQKSYEELSESQKLRDEEFIQETVDNYISPLAIMLDEAIEGYSSNRLSDWDRFIALLKINEPNVGKGYPLPLDFGICKENGNRMRCWMYPGTDCHELLMPSEFDGATAYEPIFFEAAAGIGYHDVLTSGISSVLKQELVKEAFYDPLPLPFKIAVIAAYIRQNIITGIVDACRFAAALPTQEDIPSYRYSTMPIISDARKCSGWSVLIRDITPENKMGEYLAKFLRLSAKEALLLDDQFESIAQLFIGCEPDMKQTRSKRETTTNLEDFFTRILPSKGLYVGRSGEGKRISQAEAFELFDELYPGQYQSCDTFFKRYYAARKEW